jgi:hypothetical protein
MTLKKAQEHLAVGDVEGAYKELIAIPTPVLIDFECFFFA